jgi:2-keto-4-pentenoate hydratase/2-oxohepta-3-ene-1,7-dioic acid hydratase in catechol pathway
MKLVRYLSEGASARLGLLIGDRVVPLADVAPGAPTDVLDVIGAWEGLRDALTNAAASSGIALNKVKLLAPIERPRKILAIGLNYADHIEESKAAGVNIPTEQVWFCKQPTSVNAPFGDVQLPRVSNQLDYEVELVIVIGKSGRHIPAERAHEHVFGYSVGNDVTVRDWQFKTPQWMLGKSFDTHCPFGPSIVTADEIGDPHSLGVRAFVNGELRQNSNTRHLVFNVWRQIEELSHAMTLEPGDLIFTGTPGGVGFGFKPPKPLLVGDSVRCEIDRIGVIENRIVAEV